jgi:hypothetical protein
MQKWAALPLLLHVYLNLKITTPAIITPIPIRRFAERATLSMPNKPKLSMANVPRSCTIIIMAIAYAGFSAVTDFIALNTIMILGFFSHEPWKTKIPALSDTLFRSGLRQAGIVTSSDILFSFRRRFGRLALPVRSVASRLGRAESYSHRRL